MSETIYMVRFYDNDKYLGGQAFPERSLKHISAIAEVYCTLYRKDYINFQLEPFSKETDIVKKSQKEEGIVKCV